jgi:hypothetical protein
MSDLIEACEYEVEEQFDAVLDEAASRRIIIGAKAIEARRKERERQQAPAKAAAAKAQADTYRALNKADKDPNSKCPDGFRRNAKGKCQSIHSLERESSEQSAKAIKQYKAMPMGGGAKKPSLVDKMKAMFGKK